MNDCTLFEISYEVCNKVGGIHTVLSSKAKQTKSLYDSYFLIGPYVKENAKREFIPQELPPEFWDVAKELFNRGVAIHYGTWLVDGSPYVFLLEFETLLGQANFWKGWFWEKFKIDSIHAQFDFVEPMTLSVAAGMLIEQYYKNNPTRKTIAHSHEWMCGFTNLYLKGHNLAVGTVFTTHATFLGRVMSASGIDLYNSLHGEDPDGIARRLNIYEKYTAEKACAHHSDVFTTVSEITATESSYTLSKRPDMVVPNGLDISQFPPFEKAATIHTQSRDKIRDFLQYYFYPYHRFDVDKTEIWYISGRHEIKNKGLDTTIKMLGELDKQIDKEVVVFIWVPFQTYGVKSELIQSKMKYHRVKSYLSKTLRHMQDSLLFNILENASSKSPLPVEFDGKITNLISQIQSESTAAPLSAFYIDNEEENEIIKLCRQNGLNNTPQNKVKIVYYPAYLSGFDGLLDLSYYECVSGCDLGLFASYYEPWGYTPMENAALGIPSITTDLAGFGRFMKPQKNPGIIVLDRFGKSEDDVLSDYISYIKDFISYSPHKRSHIKMQALLASEQCDWKNSVTLYAQAHIQALKQRGLL